MWQRYLLIAMGLIGCAWGSLSFSPPTVVHRASDEDVLNPQLVMHPTDFSAVAVWVSQKGSVYQLQGSFFDGSEWGAPSILGSSQTQPSPQLQIDGSGNAIAIWDQFDGSTLTLQAAHFSSSIWSAAMTLQNLGTASYSSNPNLAINSAGVAIATWLSSSLQLIGSTFNPSASGWSPSYAISESGSPVLQNVLASMMVDPNNQVTIIVPFTNRINGAFFDAFNPPSSPSTKFLRSIVCEATLPVILQNTSPESMDIFIFQDKISHYLISANKPAAGTWAFALALTAGSTLQDLTAVLNASNNRAGAAWRKLDTYIQASVYNLAFWLTPQTLSSAGHSPSLSFYQDTNTHLTAIWADEQMGAGNHSVYFSEYAFGATSWSTPTSISATSASIGTVRSAAIGSGPVLGLWTRLDGTVGPTPRLILEASVGTPAH